MKAVGCWIEEVAKRNHLRRVYHHLPIRHHHHRLLHLHILYHPLLHHQLSHHHTPLHQLILQSLVKHPQTGTNVVLANKAQQAPLDHQAQMAKTVPMATLERMEKTANLALHHPHQYQDQTAAAQLAFLAKPAHLVHPARKDRKDHSETLDPTVEALVSLNLDHPVHLDHREQLATLVPKDHLATLANWFLEKAHSDPLALLVPLALAAHQDLLDHLEKALVVQALLVLLAMLEILAQLEKPVAKAHLVPKDPKVLAVAANNAHNPARLLVIKRLHPNRITQTNLISPPDPYSSLTSLHLTIPFLICFSLCKVLD